MYAVLDCTWMWRDFLAFTFHLFWARSSSSLTPDCTCFQQKKESRTSSQFAGYQDWTPGLPPASVRWQFPSWPHHKQRDQDSFLNDMLLTCPNTCPFMGLNLRDVYLCCTWIISVGKAKQTFYNRSSRLFLYKMFKVIFVIEMFYI